MLVGAMTIMMAFGDLRANALKDITKPYLGVYQCVEANLGGRDCLDGLEELDLELKSDGTFSLYYKERNRGRKEETGKYVYDPNKKTLTLLGRGDFLKREFPLEDGILTITMRVGDKLLCVKFEQK